MEFGSGSDYFMGPTPSQFAQQSQGYPRRVEELESLARNLRANDYRNPSVTSVMPTGNRYYNGSSRGLRLVSEPSDYRHDFYARNYSGSRLRSEIDSDSFEQKTLTSTAAGPSSSHCHCHCKCSEDIEFVKVPKRKNYSVHQPITGELNKYEEQEYVYIGLKPDKTKFFDKTVRKFIKKHPKFTLFLTERDDILR